LYFEWTALRKNRIPDLTDTQRNGRVKFAGLKLFADGSVSNRTAWVREVYRNSNDHGFTTLSDDDLRAAYEWAKRNKVQIAVHAMGDETSQRVIDFFAGKEPWMGHRVPSVRLEHITLLTNEQMGQMRASKMNFGGCTQIIFFFAEYDSYSENLTDNQFRQAYPIKRLYRSLDHFAISSDAPATTWADPDNVFVSLKAAVTRQAYNGADIVSEEAITAAQAVLLYTSKAAMLAPYDGSLGQVAPGFEASFIVLDRDIFTIDASDIDQTVVQQTWIQGKKAYEQS
jgi:predicted amidohydrolase YtcJ